MKKLLYLLLFITSVSQGQAGRQWEGNGKPITKPTNFNKNDTYRDTVNKVTYKYDTKWFVTSDQREGDKGDQGIQGVQGVPGPQGPAGSGSGGSANIGGVRWVTTWNEMIAALNDNFVRSIYMAGSFTQTSKWRMPPYFKEIKYVQGNGFEWIIPSSIDTGSTRYYSSLAVADSGIDMQFRVENVIFKGNNNVGFYIEANYGSKFEGCRFYNFKVATDLRWCMGTIIEQCYYWDNYIAINLDYARFVGGDNSHSQSNHCTIRECKFRSSPGGFAAIKTNAVSGLVIEHNIFEGGDKDHKGSDYEVYFDDAGSTVVKDFTMRNCHIEQQQSVAGIYIRLNDGFAYVSSVFSQYDCNLIKFESTGYAKCIVQGIPYLTAGTKFENVNSAGRWEFIDMPATFDPLVATNWKTTAPYSPAINGWQTSGQTKYIKGITVK